MGSLWPATRSETSSNPVEKRLKRKVLYMVSASKRRPPSPVVRRARLRPLGKSLCIIEFGGHIPQLDHLRKIFSDVPEVRLYFRYQGNNNWKDNFLDRELTDFFVSDASRARLLPTLQFYRNVWFGIRPDDLIWIATGPEQKRATDMLFFILLVLSKRSRIILSVRVLSRWIRFPGEPWWKPSMVLRETLVRLIPRIVFETKAIMRTFQTSRTHQTAALGVVPTKVSDYFAPTSEQPEEVDEVFIGLTGGLDSRRRDYSQFLDALRFLPSHIRKRSTLVILGNTLRPEADQILASLRCQAPVLQGPRFLTVEEEQSFGALCTILISPLKTELHRGIVSGSFGDAISHRLQILMPKGSDPYGEFEGIVVEYTDARDLARKITFHASQRKSAQLAHETVANFQSMAVWNSISRDLHF